MKTKLLTLLCALLISTQLFAAKVLFVTGEWAPYVSQTLPNGGPITELIRAVCKAGQIDIEIRFFPWARAEVMVAEGKAFAGFPYALIDERKKKYILSDITHYGDNAFMFYDKNPKTGVNFQTRPIKDLQQFTTAIQKGNFLEPLLKGLNIPTMPVAGSTDALVRMLQSQRIEVVMDEKYVLVDTVKKLFPNEIRHFHFLTNSPVGLLPNGLIVSKSYQNSKEILSKFNKGLEKIKQNGEYKRLTKGIQFGNELE